MPTAFGNSPGPRSDLQGRPFDWSGARRLLVRWQAPCDEGALRALLAHRCTLDGPARVQLEFQKLENLPWLAGRGYSLFSIKAPVRFQLASGETRPMSLLLVMWENLADPIITGREELGYPKVFADLVWNLDAGSPTGGQASWFDECFFNFKLGAYSGRESGMLAPFHADLLHHRYVPAVGRRGEAAIDEFTCSPAGVPSAAQESHLRTIDFGFHESTWQALPTLWHIVSKLGDLKLPTSGVAEVMRFAGASDHAGQHVLA